MTKKAQATLFVLIGVAILLVIFLFYQAYTTSSDKGTKAIQIYDLSSDADGVTRYVESCLHRTASEGIAFVGFHGGYYNLSHAYAIKTDDYNTSYYFYEGKNAMPSKEIIEEEISKYVKDNIDLCINNFSAFATNDISIEAGDIALKTNLNPENAVIVLSYPLKISAQGSEKKIDSFKAIVEDVRLGMMMESAKTMTLQQMANKEYLCASCIYDLAEQNGMQIGVENDDESSIFFFTVLDNSTGIEQRLVFAYKFMDYSCSNPPPDADVSFYEQCMAETPQTLPPTSTLAG